MLQAAWLGQEYVLIAPHWLYKMTQDTHWYQEAVFYELYIRAFCDGNGDGHGDFQGAITKLDHLKSLGVDCIWIMPMFPSPLQDDGYDVADYYASIPTMARWRISRHLYRRRMNAASKWSLTWC